MGKNYNFADRNLNEKLPAGTVPESQEGPCETSEGIWDKKHEGTRQVEALFGDLFILVEETQRIRKKTRR